MTSRAKQPGETKSGNRVERETVLERQLARSAGFNSSLKQAARRRRRRRKETEFVECRETFSASLRRRRFFERTVKPFAAARRVPFVARCREWESPLVESTGATFGFTCGDPGFRVPPQQFLQSLLQAELLPPTQALQS